MAMKACSGVIELGATPDAVGDLRAYRQNSEAEEIDTTVMGQCVSRFQPGSIRHSLEVDMFFDDDDAGQALIITNLGSSTPIAVSLFPEGKGTGLAVMTGNFYVMTRNVEGAADGAIEMTSTMTSDSSGVAWSTQA